jgi:hypothetical protein
MRTVILTDGKRFFTYKFIGDPRLLKDALRIFCGLKGLKPYEFKEAGHAEIPDLQGQGEALPQIRA